MFEKTDKKRLFWLIDQYLTGQISAWNFCNEFYYCFDLELSNLNLTNLEEQAFTELSKVAARFSDIKEDLEQYPNVYYTENELKNKILEIKQRLSEFWKYTIS